MAETKISEEQVKKIAALCNLQLESQEIEKFSKILTQTLDYINVLDELDTPKVEETFQVTGLTNVFMKNGENSRTLSQNEALANAKNVIKNLFATKSIFDRE